MLASIPGPPLRPGWRSGPSGRVRRPGRIEARPLARRAARAGDGLPRGVARASGQRHAQTHRRGSPQSPGKRGRMSELTEAVEAVASEAPQFLIGIRLRDPLLPEDYLTTESDLHVGEFVIVDLGTDTALGEVRRPGPPLPEFKRGRLYRRVVRRATDTEVAEGRERRAREVQGVATCLRLARARGLTIKIVDVEIESSRRRVTVFFNSEERVDFRDLVRDLAHEFHARIEMRQIGARDTTKLMDGIGPCGRQLCCS